MISLRCEQGTGMVEVLVSLLLLSAGVLGFTGLQLRAVDASLDANNQIYALNLARDLAERIRFNPEGIHPQQESAGSSEPIEGDSQTAAWSLTDSFYYKAVNGTPITSPQCVSKVAGCDSESLAKEDARQILARASDLGLEVALDVCAASQQANSTTTQIKNERLCVYVAWGGTQLKNTSGGVAVSQDGGCVNASGAYRAEARCLFLEAY